MLRISLIDFITIPHTRTARTLIDNACTHADRYDHSDGDLKSVFPQAKATSPANSGAAAMNPTTWRGSGTDGCHSFLPEDWSRRLARLPKMNMGSQHVDVVLNK